MSDTSITLSGHDADFVEAQVAAGRYATAGEVVRAGLSLLEEREAKLQALRAAIDEGLASGPSQPFDKDAFLAEMRRKYVAGA